MDFLTDNRNIYIYIPIDPDFYLIQLLETNNVNIWAFFSSYIGAVYVNKSGGNVFFLKTFFI